MRTGDGIWRALEQARRDNLAESGAAAPIAGNWGATRRAVLKALGAGGIAALAAPLPAASRGTVAIIGGGIAGLTALHHLTNAGVDARVYEARKRTGGRMHTVTQAGVTFERGGQLVNGDHADIHALTREFGIALIDRKADAHRTMIVADGAVIPEATLADGLRAIARQIDADAQALDADYARVAPRFDRLSIAQYLDQHAALIPQPWVRHLLEQTSRTEYGVEPGQASAIELLFNLPVVDGARVEVLGGSDERFVMAGGSSSLIAALTDRHRERIELGRRPIRVAAAPGGRVTLTFLDLTTVTVDRVIVAVPASLADQIEYAVPLPTQWRAFLKVMQLGRCEKLQWAMQDTPWRATLGMGGEGWSADAAGPAALVWEGTVHGGTSSGTPIWNWFFGGDQVAAEDVALPDPATLARAFAGIASGLDSARAEGAAFNRTMWHRDPLTKGAYSNFPPGQLSRFAGLLSVEGDGAPRYSSAGRVVFAGEHLSDAFPGYMNGGAQTGRMAAEAVIGRTIAHAAA
jgi:monoamine oxidase